MHPHSRRRLRGAAGWALASLVLAGCVGDEITGPSPAPGLRTAEPSFTDIGDLPQQVTLCKIGPPGTTATFDVSASPAGVGRFPLGSTVTLRSGSLDPADPSLCGLIWIAGAPGDPALELTITERQEPGMELYQITTMTNAGTQSIENPASYSVTIPVDFANGAVVWFKNRAVDLPPPPPPPLEGGEGCTPGYWKQIHHFGNWTAPYSPLTSFKNAFGVDAFRGQTLIQVLWQGGGGLNALGRHAVAALLNAASGKVDYDLTVEEVKAVFAEAYGTKQYEDAKDYLEDFNEQGCPLGKNPGDHDDGDDDGHDGDKCKSKTHKHKNLDKDRWDRDDDHDKGKAKGKDKNGKDHDDHGKGKNDKKGGR